MTNGQETCSDPSSNLQKFGKLILGEKFEEGKIYYWMGKSIKFVDVNPKSNSFPVIYIDLNTGKKSKMSDEIACRIVDPERGRDVGVLGDEHGR